jgi:hypothetical protein
MAQVIGGYDTNQEANQAALKKVTVTTSGTKNHLDVNLASVDVELGAVELKDGDTDTRLDIETDGTKNAAYVQANDLDIRDLASATDSVTVVATDLDIRALASATDSVTAVVTGATVTGMGGAVTEGTLTKQLVQDTNSEELLSHILEQIKIMNQHLMLITDVNITQNGEEN